MRRKRRALKFEFIKQSGEYVERNRRAVLIFVMLCALAIGAGFWLHVFLRTASYFDCYAIEIIKFSESEGLRAQKEFFKLSPKINIFMADSLVLSNKIKSVHPEFQNVLITKYLPNRLIATIIDRRAVAKIKVGKFFQVDYEGMVLPQVSEKELESLPLIIGLESQLFNPSVGKKVKSSRLLNALNLLALVSEVKEFKDSVIENIDVSYPENTTFKMDGMNIILGEGEYGKKLELLSRILDDPKIQRQDIDYVDLRFADVVFGTKPTKK
ncbi:MAG: hypothetical protein AMJ78_06765 [Omnitrophica WOR_2 bacterium SM23_29]|nr:MAG: hypothetical protein AMJ78_06765 [Omnitrophica WOR_2 bacterium SM23_29]